MTGLQIGVLIYLSLSALTTVALIGKPRKTITPNDAVAVLIVFALVAVMVVMFG